MMFDSHNAVSIILFSTGKDIALIQSYERFIGSQCRPRSDAT